MKILQAKLATFSFKLLNKWVKLDSVSLGRVVETYYNTFQNGSMRCDNLLRVGSLNDGGYMMFKNFKKDYIALSFGIGSNFSWDVDISDRVSKVLMFDHTIDKPIGLMPNMEFYKLRISGAEKSENVTNVSEIVKKYSKEQEFILKMDIEGSEWSVLESTPSIVLKQMSQIIIEFHDIVEYIFAGRVQRIMDIVEKLNETHTLVNFHPNNYGLTMQMGGHQVSDVVEVTYVRRDLLEHDHQVKMNVVQNENMPNNQDKVDVTFRSLF